MNNVQRYLCHFYTWMRHSKQTATLLLTKRHANFDTSTSAKGYARVYELRMRNCSPWHTACSGSPHNALHSSSWGEPERAPHRQYNWAKSYMYYYYYYYYYYHYRTTVTRAPRLVARSMWGFQYHIRIHGFRDRKRITHAPRFVARSTNITLAYMASVIEREADVKEEKDAIRQVIFNLQQRIQAIAV